MEKTVNELRSDNYSDTRIDGISWAIQYVVEEKEKKIGQL